jgi:hypothetical protein
MILATIRERLATLANKWSDLSETFRRLATALHDANPADPNIPLIGNPVRTDPALALEQGFQRDCYHDNTVGGVPAAPPGEFQRLVTAIAALPTAPLAPPPGVAPVPPTTITNAIGILNASRGALVFPLPPLFNGLVWLQIRFSTLYPNPAADTTEMATCRDRMAFLSDFIDRQAADLQDLLEEVSQRFHLSGIRASVESLSGYPILTSEMGMRGGNGGGQVTDAPGTGSFRRTVEVAIRDVLGRIPRAADTRTLLSSLTQSFQPVDHQGRTEYRWVQRAFAGTTDLGGGVSGGQASLYTRAKAVEENVFDLLDDLYPLREDADEELTDAARNIVRSEFEQLVEELGMEGGPRRTRVDGLIDLLFKQPVELKLDGVPVIATGHLDVLRLEFGLENSRVNTLEEEANFTNFVAARDYIASIRASWETFRDTFYGKDLGTRLVLLSRAMSVAADSVVEASDAMDSVFVGSAERQVASFYDETGQRVFVGELLSWISTFTRDEAPALIHSGGRRGVEAIIPTVTKLRELVSRLVESIPSETDLPDGMRHPRVVNPLRELRGHLELVRRHAEEVKRP